jgi:hypothetical protein
LTEQHRSTRRKECKVNSEVRLLRTPTFDLDYRLCRCEGFRVDSPGGRVGVVEEVHFHSRIDRPDALAVRTGFLGRPLLIPVDDVAEVSFREERVVLVRAPQRNELGRRLAGLAKRGRARD